MAADSLSCRRCSIAVPRLSNFVPFARILFHLPRNLFQTAPICFISGPVKHAARVASNMNYINSINDLRIVSDLESEFWMAAFALFIAALRRKGGAMRIRPTHARAHSGSNKGRADPVALDGWTSIAVNSLVHPDRSAQGPVLTIFVIKKIGGYAHFADLFF